EGVALPGLVQPVPHRLGACGHLMDETTTSSRRAPLEGVLVVEVGVFMAAPFATMQLADLGARVVKVEPVDGDPVRRSGPFVDGEGSVFLRLNRNKES